MCELSNECTKLGGNALLCFLTDTWNIVLMTKIVQKENKSGISRLFILTALPSLCKAKS